MDFGLTGKAHLSFNNITIIGTLGNNTHVHTIPDNMDFRSSYIDEALSPKVELFVRTLTITGTGLITVEYEPRTKMLSILTSNTADFTKLAVNAKLDPKAKELGKKWENILNQLPPDGLVGRFVDTILTTKWLDMIAEFINAVRKAYPQEWAKIENTLPKEFSDWLASKLKI